MCVKKKQKKMTKVRLDLSNINHFSRKIYLDINFNGIIHVITHFKRNITSVKR